MGLVGQPLFKDWKVKSHGLVVINCKNPSFHGVARQWPEKLRRTQHVPFLVVQVSASCNWLVVYIILFHSATPWWVCLKMGDFTPKWSFEYAKWWSTMGFWGTLWVVNYKAKYHTHGLPFIDHQRKQVKTWLRNSAVAPKPLKSNLSFFHNKTSKNRALCFRVCQP